MRWRRLVFCQDDRISRIIWRAGLVRMALVLELGGGVGAGLVNGWPGRWSPLSPAVAFATHARSNAPRRPRASKRIGSERDDGRASKESRESSDSTDSIISIISINSIRPTVIPGLLAPPPLAGQTWHGHPARVSWAERPCREDGARTVQGHARSAHLNPHLDGTLVLLHPLTPLLLTILGRMGHRGHR